MKRGLFILIIAAVSGLLGLGAEEDLIPRRIRIIDPAGDAPPMAAAILYSRLTRQIPLVVSGDDEEPHNLIVLEYGDELSVILQEGTETLDRRSYPADLIEDPEAAAGEFDILAADWQPMLGLVEPDVSEELDIRREEMEAEVSFEERLITPHQLTLWLPVAARQIAITDGDSGDSNNWIWQWPVRLDYGWYFGENLGLMTSFRFEYGNHISFGADTNREAQSTLNLMLMPGLGLQVRTIGKISAEFGVSVLFGIIRVEAEADLAYPNLADGDSTWIFYPVLSLEPAIVWSPSARWSVKFRLMEINLGLAGFEGSEGAGFGTGENTLIFNFLQIGVAYRW